jgi:hypothetical protein
MYIYARVRTSTVSPYHSRSNNNNDDEDRPYHTYYDLL